MPLDTDTEPMWYKDAVIYELHIKAFYDSSADGIGDLKGLIEKLDYLRDLGVTAIWVLPFYPSPRRDDGYDIADYMDIHPDYGVLRDFKRLLREAHKRGLRVITELVINHTSDQHEWFQKARRAKPGSAARDFYVWSDSPEKYQDARIIFKDFEHSNWTWDPVAKAYYWHRFYHHQPDLNFDNPAVHKAVLKALDFWLKMGVDGLRLDAIPYLYEREGTNCENLPETHVFLKKLRKHVDERYENRMLLAEANQWPEDAVAYFGEGDSCHMAFHFPLMPRMFMALQMEDRYPIIDILEQTPEIPETAQWAVFLRNHDELTLEMVSDEERDYMYRMYARDPKARINLGIRRRLAPLLGNDRRKIELMNVILFCMPGTPVLYYGDELGMGDNYYLGDRDGVRTPMQWSSDRNAGFSRANPQRLYLPVVIDPEYHYEAVNVETQQSNKSSLLWWMKNFIAMRKRYKAFGRGTIEFLLPHNPKVLSFVRTFEGQHILVVANLSRYAQAVSIDLAAYQGYYPKEVFSRTRFAQIKGHPYTLTINSYGYYIFHLVMEEPILDHDPDGQAPVCVYHGSGRFLDAAAKRDLQAHVLPGYLRRRGWMGERENRFKAAQILEALPMGGKETNGWLVILEVSYLEGPPEVFNLLITFLFGEEAEEFKKEHPAGVICQVQSTSKKDEGAQPGVILEGLWGEDICGQVAPLFQRQQALKGRYGELVITPGEDTRQFVEAGGDGHVTGLMVRENHTTVVCGDEVFFKIFRKAEEGMHPDLEVVRFLTQKAQFKHTPRFLGAIEYKRGGYPMVLGVLKEYLPRENDAWNMCLHALELYFDRVIQAELELAEAGGPPTGLSPMDVAVSENGELHPVMAGLMGSSEELMAKLGQRTAELHMALASDHINPDFAPETFSTLYQRSLYQGLQSRVKRTLQKLGQVKDGAPEEYQGLIEEIVSRREDILAMLKAFLEKKLKCLKTRVHGDYHLGHVLFTGKDFFIVNFEGKHYKSLSERRIKRSPLRDLGDMVRSLHHVALSALAEGSVVRPEDRARLEPWAEAWRVFAAGAFLRSYMKTVEGARLIPEDEEGMRLMLQAFLLEKSFMEVDMELKRPTTMFSLPLKAILSLLD